ncbi:disease resistance protein RUN1-like [Rhodamnia argentea]|uniref:Disease resistance protein RUN1-like n=1 Tax=Rhodamnia argentea TaxID=178133 RepID=A0ABM3HAB7_9MYRT|nr:disease resistance protein RUN1-like [Rhodamnia argentea]
MGLDDHAKEITDLLEMEVDDEVRIIGIHGTDGIGKTTVAKAVYDLISSCFDNRSFLAEVRETEQDATGIQFLQTKLIRDILERDRDDPSFGERIEDFLDIFRERKVLIVIDDVEEQSLLHAIVGEQLHWFGPGSRIIVTSENEEILKEYDPEKARTYLVSALDDGQAFELFCKHAFRMQSSIREFDGLANRIVNATEKLPLAVEVVGSFLRGKSIQEWAKMEKSMKERTRSSGKTTVGPEEILDICYRELDQKQKDIFLDIAGFISGVDARIASYMWPNDDLPSSGCILMPLAKTGENNELQMHRLLRCIGKGICKQEESQDPRSRRFCTQDMILKAMNREMGMGNVEALCFDFAAGDFQSMPKIRFLKLDNAKFSGNFAGAFASLRWLCWQRCPPEFDAENLVLRELAILELPWGKITEDWGGWSKIKMEKLKVLNLTGCSDLLFTPDFSGCQDLEILILEGCSRLVKLDPSIRHLKRLVSLNLKSCSRLNSLPVEINGMTALKELFIDGTSVREIPISIGNLKKLEILSGFQCFPLTHLPRSICYLTALSELLLDGAEITKLPSSLGDRLKLRRLSLRNCRYLEELPDSIGKMGSSLEELDISATCISELPSSIRNLESLKVLRMDYSFIRAFPGEIGNLTKLDELHASWCRSLKGAVPRDIKRLHHLSSLTLGHSSISILPSEISALSSLHTLDLLQCNEIEVLPQLPSSLIRLRVSSTRMKSIPILKDLKELEELCLSDEDPKERRPPSEQPMPESNVQHPSRKWFSRLWNLKFLQTQRIDKQSFSIAFPKLRKLELSLSQIIKLKFRPTDIPQLKTLILSSLSLGKAQYIKLQHTKSQWD